MGRQFGTDRSIFNTLSAPLVDPDGLPIIDTSTGFGSSPLGVSLREQIQFGLPNATFNLLPPDPASAISEGENPLPFWEIQTTPNIAASAVYDSTTQTWGVKLDPGTAPSGDYLTLKTRAWVTTDDNIQLRQRASLVASKNGTYSGATQWNLSLTSVYYNHANSPIGTVTIGTVYDNASFTGITGLTTTGGSAISSSASWVEFTVKLTVTATVSSSTSVTLKSLLLATSSASFSSFLVTEYITTSTTWTPPTGVTNLLGVVVIGAGGGGASGEGGLNTSTNSISPNGGAGGGGARWAYAENFYVGNIPSISVGIGAKGVGGAGGTFTYTAGSGSTSVNQVNGTGGGATTFGTFITVPGGGGGLSTGGGTAGGTITSSMYGITSLAAGAGGADVAQGTATAGANGGGTAYSNIPFTPLPTAGQNGQVYSLTGSATVTVGGYGTARAGISGGGGGGAGAAYSSSVGFLGAGTGANGGIGGGGGGAAGVYINAGSVTITIRGSNGGNASGSDSIGANCSGGGGGGGGGVLVRGNSGMTATVVAGSGGDGSTGVVALWYVA